MRRVIVATLGLLLVALPAAAQQAVPIHNHTMTAGPLTGAIQLASSGFYTASGGETLYLKVKKAAGSGSSTTTGSITATLVTP